MTGKRRAAQRKPEKRRRKWLPLLTEVWILAVIIIFLLVRVLGSSTAKNLLHKTGH
jgi:hypothetical protein